MTTTTVAGRVCAKCARPLVRPPHCTDKKWAKRKFCSNACRAPKAAAKPARPNLEPPAERIPDRVWRPLAACLGQDLGQFYPDKPGNGVSDDAKAVCHRCPVRTPCLEYALNRRDRFGVWGGLTGDERDRLLAARARLARRQAT